MLRIKTYIWSVIIVGFLTSYYSSETTDYPAKDHVIYSQIESDSIQHIITIVVNDLVYRSKKNNVDSYFYLP